MPTSFGHGKGTDRSPISRRWRRNFGNIASRPRSRPIVRVARVEAVVGIPIGFLSSVDHGILRRGEAHEWIGRTRIASRRLGRFTELTSSASMPTNARLSPDCFRTTATAHPSLSLTETRRRRPTTESMRDMFRPRFLGPPGDSFTPQASLGDTRIDSWRFETGFRRFLTTKFVARSFNAEPGSPSPVAGKVGSPRR